ncbi:MAG: hypothetical protein ACR2QJ_14695 [Geminicoccaceae bacterium]
MLTIQDCIGMCQLTEDEVAAIAEHEHIPDIVALEMGNYLCVDADGKKRISRMIAEDIEMARARGDLAHAAKLRHVLRHFLETHAGIALDDKHEPSKRKQCR